MDWFLQLYHSLLAVLQSGHPAWVVAAIVFLPLCGVPVIPLLVLAGLRLGPVLGSVAACGALTLNLSGGYWLAARWLRQPVEKLLARRGHKIPSVAPADEVNFILLCRLTPGLPLTLQNYLLGGARVRFGRYLLVSLPIQLASAVGFVVFGNSLAHSSVWKVVAAAGLVVAVLLLLSLARKWSRSRLQPRAAMEPTLPVGPARSTKPEAGAVSNLSTSNSGSSQ